MAKQRRGPSPGEREPRATEPPTRAEVTPELDQQVGIGGSTQRTEHLAALAAERDPAWLAERVGLALRVAPHDRATTERLVDLVARSALADDRRQAVIERLQGDQVIADEVAAAVATWFGSDGEALRSELVGAFDAAGLAAPDRSPALAGAAGPDPEALVAGAVATRLGVEPERVEGLCRQLGLLLALLWDDEEEQAPPGDYAAEESGS